LITEGGTGIQRVVALGASNLTRGFGTVVSTARAVWGPEIQVVAALGHGRSYGADSFFLARRLSGILDSGLWRHLETAPSLRTRALITDLGNDIAYGVSADQVLAWVDEALDRIARVTRDITMTDLPLASMRRLSRAKFLAFRSVLAPSCALSLAQVIDTAERVNSGLAALACSRGVRFVHLHPDWYGFDPIHIRPSLWQSAWREILGAGASSNGRSAFEQWRLYLMAPERQWIFGVERVTPQLGVRLSSGARVWLY
jgi:hypothetical protein